MRRPTGRRRYLGAAGVHKRYTHVSIDRLCAVHAATPAAGLNVATAASSPICSAALPCHWRREAIRTNGGARPYSLP